MKYIALFLVTIATFVISGFSSDERTNSDIFDVTCYENVWFYDNIRSDCDSDYYMKVYKVACSSGAVKQFYYWSGPTSSNPFSACPSKQGYYERISFTTDPYLGNSTSEAISKLCSCR